MSRYYTIRSTHLENSPPTTRAFSSENGVGTPSDFTIPITLPWQNDFNRVAVLQVAVPTSLYGVTNGQNSFKLLEPGMPEFAVTVQARNYTLVEWMAALTTAMNLASATSGHGYTYDVDFDEGTGKFTLTVAGSGGNTPSLIFTTFMYNMLGFRPNTTNVFTNDGVLVTLTSTTLVNLKPVPLLYLKSDLVWDSDSRHPDLLQDIPVTGPDGAWSIYTCPHPEAYAKKVQPTRGNVYRFYFRDALGNAVDFNGIPVYISLWFFRDDSADERDKFMVPTPKPSVPYM